MVTYKYRLIHKPNEGDLNLLGAEGWRVIATGTDPRDGALAWVLVERVDSEVPTMNIPQAQVRRGKS